MEHPNPAPSPGHRRVRLPDGRVLTVREVAPADVDGLEALYATLSEDDRYLRFFSAYVPPREFFEHLATVASRGGDGVVAVTADGRIVGEANYELLPDGDGELGIVVAPDARGRLGAFLLDALIEAAAGRGVPNIEASVLATNGRMLSLLRARGYATLTSDDWVSLRIIVGTAGATPVWPHRGDADRSAARAPRVLVETPGGRWSGAEQAEADGLAVIACSGPRGPRTRCPALAGRPCPLVAEADVVVMANPPVDDRWTDMLAAHATLHPDVPVCVQTRDGPRVAVSVVERTARRHRDDRCPDTG
jgi:RimJ/RimL family protein N-acetyltransferase